MRVGSSFVTLTATVHDNGRRLGARSLVMSRAHPVLVLGAPRFSPTTLFP